MKDNQGFTLMELIVVMIILAIIGIGSMAGFQLLNSGDARNASERIITKLDYIQLSNMTKAKTYTLVLEQDPVTGDITQKVILNQNLPDSSVESSEELDLKDGQITARNNLGEDFTVTVSQPLSISFRKDTGGLKEDGEGKTISKITVSASGRNYDIWLVKETGKHFIE